MLLYTLTTSCLRNGKWQEFKYKTTGEMDGIKIQTLPSSPFYIHYRTRNEGRSSFYSFVDSNENDYAGMSGKPVQLLQLQVYKNNGTKLTSNIVAMYRVSVKGRWLPWVSNADPEWMESVHSKYHLDGTIDTSSYYAGNIGQNIDGLEIRVYDEDSVIDGGFTGGEAEPTLSYMIGDLNNWRNFPNVAFAPQMDGIKIQTDADKNYYLEYQTKNEGMSDYLPLVKSTGTAYNDYAGLPGKPIQLLRIQAYDKNGNRLRSGIIVMYRVHVVNRWLPWVSNADPEWMRSAQSKYSLGGTLDTESTYAGNDGENITGVEIRIFEDDSSDPGLDPFTGSEIPLTTQYMANNLDNWTTFDRRVSSERIDGIKIQTSADDPFYLKYKSWNAGNSDYYPTVTSTENDYNDYAGLPGHRMQLLSIQAYDNNGNRLRSGIVIMYRVSVNGRWLPWVSNADPEWMRSVQQQYNLGGTLDTRSTYAGNMGQNIDGVEIRAFQGSTNDHPLGELPGAEASVTLSYMRDNLDNWTSFTRKVETSPIEGIKIQTSKDKDYYLEYKSRNAGMSDYFPLVKSTGTAYNDYACLPGKPIQLLHIQAYRKDGVRLRDGIVVMYRVHVDNRWLPWVSNADPEWMVAVQSKYNLGGILDTKSTYAGNIGQNINGVEIRIFEENDTSGTTHTPVGDYKIIDVPFISQIEDYPTGCESVSTVMALNYAGFDTTVDTFIDKYLDRGSNYHFDPYIEFGGNPRSTTGWGCYAEAIQLALNKFLPEEGGTSQVLRNKTIASLCSEYIDKNIPVVFWATQEMDTIRREASWDVNGKHIVWKSPFHCLLLVGYDDYNYIFNDPMCEYYPTYYPKEAVEAAYAAEGKQALVIVKSGESVDPEEPEEPKSEYEVAEALEKIDRAILMDSYYLWPESECSDYNFLACLQLLYLYYWDKEDFEKTDFLFDQMLYLRKLHPDYRTIYKEFLDADGEFDLGYEYYAPGRKTTTLTFLDAAYFTKETIIGMHRADDIGAFLLNFVPYIGGLLSFAVDKINEKQQQETVTITPDVIEAGVVIGEETLDVMAEINESLKVPIKTYSVVSTILSIPQLLHDIFTEDRERYVISAPDTDKTAVVQEGDAFIQVKLQYDMGIESHEFRFFFRNGYPYVTDFPQYVSRWDDSNMGLPALGNYDDFAEAGYVPSEKHEPRGPYWPGEDD